MKFVLRINHYDVIFARDMTFRTQLTEQADKGEKTYDKLLSIYCTLQQRPLHTFS